MIIRYHLDILRGRNDFGR